MTNELKSFWMGGFECSDQLNAYGDRVDLLQMTGHLDLIREDYGRLASLGILTVREGIRWSVVEHKPYQYNFEPVREMMSAAKEYGVQQIWDICHFGYPDDLSPLYPHFLSRFVALCEAFTNFYIENNPGETLYVTPVNEVSFISWLGGEEGKTVPYCNKHGWELKYALMKAYIAGAKAIKEITPLVRIITTEPLVNMVPDNTSSTEDVIRATHENEQQFQAVDMLCGRLCPELGGREDLVDIIGYNYYYNNQWIAGSFEFLGWNDPVPDPRYKPLSDLLEAACKRYDKPFILSETSHPKVDRPLWIKMISTECAKVLANDLPLLGICLYPVIDRPDWDHPDIWHNSGLWDTDFLTSYGRVLHEPSVAALLAGQELISRQLVSNKRP